MYDCFEAYYTSLVECVLSDNKTLFIKMLNDLKCNPRVGRLVSYLTTFVSAANLVSHDLSKLSQMLYVVKALINNKHISVQLYLKPLLKAVLYCVLEPLAASINPLNDHWIVRDYGALLAAQLIYSHAAETDFLLSHVHSSIEDILTDTTKPLCSHYGALMLTTMLGKGFIRMFILPNLSNYMKSFLQPIIEDTSSSDIHMKMDAHKVLGACTFCLEKLHYDISFEQPGLKLRFPDLDSTFTELFGDSLIVRLPLQNFETSKKDSSFEKKPTSAIPWHCYSLSSKMSSGFVQDQPKKLSITDHFYPVHQIRRNKPIQINFGLARPVKSKHCFSNKSEQITSNSAHQLQLVRRIVPSQRRFLSSNIYSWL